MSYTEYQDPAISRYLRFGYWYQAHRYRLRIAVTVFLGVVASVMWILFFVYLILWFQGRNTEKVLFQSFVEDTIPVTDIHATRDALPLVAEETFAVPGVSATIENIHTYDLGSLVSNPNDAWEITAEYRFIWDNGSTVKKIATIAPQSERVFAVRGVSAQEAPVNAVLELIPLSWQRITSVSVLDRARATRTGLAIRNAYVQTNSDQTVLSYSVENSSVYVLHNVQLGFMLRSLNGTIAAYAEQTLDTVLPGRSQTYEQVWLRGLSGGLSAEMVPLSVFLSDDEFSISQGTGITF